MVEGGGKDCIASVDLLASTPKRNLKVGNVPGRVKFPNQHRGPLLVLHAASTSMTAAGRRQSFLAGF
jgi:hypothetical protein